MIPRLVSRPFFLALAFCVPVLLLARPIVLINSLPSGASLYGTSPMGLKFPHGAGAAEQQKMDEALNGSLSDLLSKAESQNLSYVCLMALPSAHPVHLYIISALADLELSPADPAVTLLYFRGGVQSLRPAQYSLETPPQKALAGMTSMTFKKIEAPKGISTTGWIYFNLSRVQAKAEKAGSKWIYLQSGGTGASKPVVIPGLKETLTGFDDNATLTATWTMDPADEAAHRAAASP